MVQHTTPFQHPQPDWPDAFIESLSPLSSYMGMMSEHEQLHTREAFDAVADRPFLDNEGNPIANSAGQPIPMIPEWMREIIAYSESPELREACQLPVFEAAADEAGSLVRGLPQAVKNILWTDWKTTVILPSDKELWMSAVFELAWQKHANSGLTAQRWAWMDNYSIPVGMLDPKTADRRAPGFDRVSDAAGFPAAYWFSKINDFWQASLAAIDLLTSLLQQATDPTSVPNRTEGYLIDRLLAGPDDAELSPRELALVEAHLKQRISMSAIQQERRATGESATQARRNKLKLIRDFNLNLRNDSSEIASTPPAKEGLAGFEQTSPSLGSRGYQRRDNAAKPSSIDDLDNETPALNTQNGDWVTNKRAAELDGLETRTLSDYRGDGEKTGDGMFGRDKDGRIWRRSGTARSHPKYLKSSLRSQAKP